jgi:predicted ATPase
MITSISVQHFKSLSDVSVDFRNINLLVGPNGSGKSNVVDALRFLRDAVIYGLDHATSDRGGVDELRQYSPRKPYIISIIVSFKYDLEDTIEDMIFAT